MTGRSDSRAPVATGTVPAGDRARYGVVPRRGGDGTAMSRGLDACHAGPPQSVINRSAAAGRLQRVLRPSRRIDALTPPAIWYFYQW